MTEAASSVDVSVPDALDGERLDRVVAMLDGCSRSAAAQLIDSGEVRLDDRVVSQRSLRVQAGSRLQFSGVLVQPLVAIPQDDVDFEVRYLDDDIIIIAKPSGLVVHPGAGRRDGTLANGLVARFPEIAELGEPERPGIVHRLDADTSGLLVVARSSAAYTELVSALSQHRVERVYFAVVAGLVTDDRGVVDAPLSRSSKQRTKMAVVADGRWARTHYEVRDRSPEHSATLLRCELETGRTHQIRVHLAAIGHPVLGDTVYGPRAGSSMIGRVALHAHQLRFAHPVTGEQVEFEAPLPPDLVNLQTEVFGS